MACTSVTSAADPGRSITRRLVAWTISPAVYRRRGGYRCFAGNEQVRRQRRAAQHDALQQESKLEADVLESFS